MRPQPASITSTTIATLTSLLLIVLSLNSARLNAAAIPHAIPVPNPQSPPQDPPAFPLFDVPPEEYHKSKASQNKDEDENEEEDKGENAGEAPAAGGTDNTGEEPYGPSVPTGGVNGDENEIEDEDEEQERPITLKQFGYLVWLRMKRMFGFF